MFTLQMMLKQKEGEDGATVSWCLQYSFVCDINSNLILMMNYGIVKLILNVFEPKTGPTPYFRGVVAKNEETVG